MKKLMLLILAMLFVFAVEAKENLPFAPKPKSGKHKTWKQKPVKQSKLINCAKFWK
jgi:hypothetical protein